MSNQDEKRNEEIKHGIIQKQDEISEEVELSLYSQPESESTLAEESHEANETSQDDHFDHHSQRDALDKTQSLAILEGLLFIVGDEGLSLEQAGVALECTQEEVEPLLDELQQIYLSDEHGIELVRYGGVMKFISKAMIHPYAQKLFQNTKINSLSQAALETLAIIAYKGPITRVEIEEIRGVGADMMLRKLMARDLIKESGRSEAAGRPILYEVTSSFLDDFKLLSLDELPDLPQFATDDEADHNLFNQ